MFEKMGFCGINCDNCDIFKAANDKNFAIELADKWKKWNPKAVASWFQCKGCKGDASLCWSRDCKIMNCAKSKNIEHCGQCSDFKCQLIIDFENDEHKHHSAAIKHLEELSKK